MKIFYRGHALWLTTIMTLTGCGGGGGGGQPNLPTVQPFTSWSAVQPNSKVTAQGMSISPSGVVDTSASSATLTFGSNRQLTGVQINTPAGSITWDQTVLGGGTVACGNGVCTASKGSGSSEAVTIDPYSSLVGWNYQSFGVWQTGTTTSGTFGAMSFGAPSPVGGLPTTGSATYVGLTAGVYVDPTGQLFGTAAKMTTAVNFGTRNIAFNTTATTAVTASGVSLPNPLGLNLSGTVTYAAGTTQFAVPVTTANPQLTGTATGRFYGPAAEEIGGVYSLNGMGQSMGGAFGGKK